MSKLQPKQKAPEFHVCDTSGAVKFVIKPNDAGAICFYPVSGGVMSGTASLVLPSTGLTAADVGAIAKGTGTSAGAIAVWNEDGELDGDTELNLQGNPGADGADGTSAYVHIRWGTSATPATLLTTPNTYIGICSSSSATAPTTYSGYSWYKYKGDDGATGNSFLQGVLAVSDDGKVNLGGLTRLGFDDEVLGGSLDVWDLGGYASYRSVGGIPKYISPWGNEYSLLRDVDNAPSLGSKTINGTASTTFTDYLGATISVDSGGWSSNTTSGFYYRCYGGGASTAASFGVGSISVTDQYQDSGIIHITEPGYYLVWGSLGLWNATGSTVNSISHVIELYSHAQFNAQNYFITRVGRTVNSIAHNASAGALLQITPQMIKWDGSDPNGAFVTHAIHKYTTANIKYQNPFLAIVKLASL